jgi:TnpA family transposase
MRNTGEEIQSRCVSGSLARAILHRRAQVSVNKGEAENALASALVFNRLGEMRDGTSENQRYRTGHHAVCKANTAFGLELSHNV